MSDTFIIQVRDQTNNILRPTVNRNWSLATLLGNIKIAAGGVDMQSIGIDDSIYSLAKHGTKKLHELGIVPNKQIISYVTLNGGKLIS